MPTKKSAPDLKLIGGSLAAHREVAPPAHLGDHGRTLWGKILAEYDIQDAGGQQILEQACASVDRAEACRVEIERDGQLLKTKTGWRDHPLLRHEVAARSFAIRALARLNLDVEPLKAPGRPPGQRGG